MRTVHEMSALTGVSVRTLHHYDAIGLLKPSGLTPSLYRLYDDAAVERLQTILLFRELQFPLKEIKEILERPTFDRKAALTQQIGLLELQKQRLEQLIALAQDIQTEGGKNMDFSAFDKSKLEEYAKEAKAKWGDTPAYGEYEKKTEGKTMEQQAAAGETLMGVLAAIAADKTLPVSDGAVQAKVAALQQHITEHFYPCTKDILAGLGQMYVGDERFSKNIDAAGGEGAAQYVSSAIECFCK